MHAHFDLVVGAGSFDSGRIAQGVLVAGLIGGLLVSLFDGGAGQFGIDAAAGGVGVFGEQVAVSLAGEMQLLELIQAGYAGGIDGDGIDGDVVGEQDFENVGVGVAAVVFLAVADDEDQFAAGGILAGERLRGGKDGVVKHMGAAQFVGGGDAGIGIGVEGDVVDGRAIGQRAAVDGHSGVGFALHLIYLAHGDVEALIGDGSEVRLLTHGSAIGEQRDHVIGTEGAGQGAERLLNAAEGEIGHTGIDDDGGGEGKGFAGEIFNVLPGGVVIDGEIVSLEAIDESAGAVFHGDGHSDQAYIHADDVI